MIRYNYRLFVFLLAVVSWTQVYAIDVLKITCEMMEDPSGIAVAQPRLGWRLMSDLRGDHQTAYHIIVSSSKEKIEHGSGDMWNSGRIKSSDSQHLRYAGKSLTKGTRYYWRVRVWGTKGKVSAWSAVGYWDMAPDLSTKDVQWIGAITRLDSKLPAGRDYHSPVLKKKEIAEKWNNVDSLAKRSITLRKAVTVTKKVSKAIIYISGLGHYELTVNGKKIGQSEFAPLWSDYDKTVYYNTYKVDSALQSGHNVVGVLLGNGMYNVTGTRYRKLLVSFGPPTLFFRMEIHYGDGTTQTVSSDETWRYAESAITFNCIYGGEDYDARLEQEGWDKPGFDDRHWKPVVIQEAPRGSLRPQLAAPVKNLKRYAIKSIREPQPGVYVLDMGQNLSGYPTLKVQGKRGQTVRLLVGELLTQEGTVNQKRSGGPYYYTYTLRGSGVEIWHPRFSYYGFQYIQVEGADMKASAGQEERPVILSIESNFLYNAAGEVGNFTCSNEIFNQAHILINNAVKSNWQSVFTDCPHREKLGWLEETHLNGPGLFYTYNLVQYIPKIMQDMADGQRADGLIPNIVPEYVIFGGDFTDSPEWGTAVAVLPWMYYEYYGDPSLIEQYYPVMKRYVDYLASKADGHILSHGLGDWYDYGEHAAGYSKNTPIALSATAHYYFATTLLQKAATFLHHDDDAVQYQEQALKVRQAYNKKFFQVATNQYATGSQYANAISLFLDLVDPPNKQTVLNNLVADIRRRGNRLTTGDIGNRYLYQALARNDQNEVMYDLHNHYDAPGYGFQIKFGLTTLTEQWDPRKGNSWNHFMMGQIDEWFYRTLAGIVPDEKNPGFKQFIIRPVPTGDLTFVRASHRTLYGDIVVDWKKQGNMFTLTLNVPVNTTATVILPDAEEIWMDDVAVSNVKRVTQSGTKRQASISVESGRYVFRCKREE